MYELESRFYDAISYRFEPEVESVVVVIENGDRSDARIGSWHEMNEVFESFARFQYTVFHLFEDYTVTYFYISEHSLYERGDSESFNFSNIIGKCIISFFFAEYIRDRIGHEKIIFDKL